jgi:hypothetical protein
VLAKFGKFPFEHFAWGQAVLYYNYVSTVIRDRILGKAWEAHLAMLVAGKKCWAGFMKKWLFKNQPQEVVGFLPLIQPLQEMTPQFAAIYALLVGIVQPPLGTIPRITHIHPTHLAGVRGWLENEVLCYNAHNVWVGA